MFEVYEDYLRKNGQIRCCTFFVVLSVSHLKRKILFWYKRIHWMHITLSFSSNGLPIEFGSIPGWVHEGYIDFLIVLAFVNRKGALKL